MDTSASTTAAGGCGLSLPPTWGVRWVGGAVVAPMSAAMFLASDLIDLVQRRCILEPFLAQGVEDVVTFASSDVSSSPPPVITPQVDENGFVRTAHWGILQVQYIQNILQSLPQRVHQQAHEEDDGGWPGGSKKRVAKVLLTDGKHCVVALERDGGSCEGLDDVCFGAKVRVTSRTLRLRCGMIMLERDSFFVVGGSVRRLQVYWDKVVRSLSSQLQGGPAIREHTSGAALGVPPQPAPLPTHTAVLSADGARSNQEPQRRRTTDPAPAKRERDEVINDAAPPPSKVPPTQQKVPLLRQLVVDGMLAEVRGDLTVHTTGEFVLPVLILVTNVIEGSASDVGGGEMVVDLGHPWLRMLLGMSSSEFLDTSDAADSGDAVAQGQLQAVIDRVSSFLEGYGSGRLRLGLRGRVNNASPNGIKDAVDDALAQASWVVLEQERHS